jgi:hypothetical protein
MSNRRVSIIERVKQNGKWVWGQKWELPVKFTLKEGSRQGKFYVLWYRGNDKQFTPVPPIKKEQFPDLGEALRLAKMKQRHLEDAADGLQRPDPITPVLRVTIPEAVQKFVAQIELTKNALTYKIYEQNLREYSEWTKLKPGKLADDEMAIMREHCYRGYKIISRIPFLTDVAEIVHAHHERYDGMGYPRGLMGKQIPVGARLVAVANTLDSITSDLPYRPAQTFEAALKEIELWSGRQFDPQIVTAFLEMPANVWKDLRNSL